MLPYSDFQVELIMGFVPSNNLQPLLQRSFFFILNLVNWFGPLRQCYSLLRLYWQWLRSASRPKQLLPLANLDVTNCPNYRMTLTLPSTALGGGRTMALCHARRSLMRGASLLLHFKDGYASIPFDYFDIPNFDNCGLPLSCEIQILIL